LNVAGDEVLIIAFNRVIAEQLRTDITAALKSSPHKGEPIIRTVHALCLQVIGGTLRLLLDHEREAMLYDVLEEHPKLRDKYKRHGDTDQALRNHEAKHEEHVALWQAVRQWLTRHSAQLISDLPGLLLDRLHAGGYTGRKYSHVIVDEFQDLTPGEQELFLRLRKTDGSLVALGDPRQSIYAFRGNDREGLDKLETLVTPLGVAVTDMPMNECQRCPSDIVEAANELMGLYKAKRMTPARTTPGNTHVVVWDTPADETAGMARAILGNVKAHKTERHLVMVTRRQFGYALRDAIAARDTSIKVELSFSESLLETWSVREAFLFFCLITDPDAPTWRAWLGYENSSTGKGFKAADRNAGAYLRLLSDCKDAIDEEAVRRVADEPKKPKGGGGGKLWERCKRFVDLKDGLSWDGKDAQALLDFVFDAAQWPLSDPEEAATARLDMQLVAKKASAILDEETKKKPSAPAAKRLKVVAQVLRYDIATREQFESGETADIHVATLWGAKGVTADHVYILGLCDEALPGSRREEYPGTDADFIEEQRRLFYVSITRSKSTLVLSRASRIERGTALRLGLKVKGGYMCDLNMCQFLRDIIKFLPAAANGAAWKGCVTK
jgi:superfamily I DNA/RNA helicase